eukprot:7682750-Pyramimonas_sp.AAC.1
MPWTRHLPGLRSRLYTHGCLPGRASGDWRLACAVPPSPPWPGQGPHQPKVGRPMAGPLVGRGRGRP